MEVKEMEIDESTEFLVRGHEKFKSEHIEYINNNQKLSKKQRLDIIWDICKDLPCADSWTSAKLQLDTTINIVENVFTNIPWNPNWMLNDGRIYPAQADFRRKSFNDFEAVFAHKAHISVFVINGAIQVYEKKNNQVIFEKQGLDGRKLGDFYESAVRKIS